MRGLATGAIVGAAYHVGWVAGALQQANLFFAIAAAASGSVGVSVACPLRLPMVFTVVTAAEVMDDLPGNSSYSTVRTQLRVLETKGHVRHEEEGLRYVYLPALPRRAARRSAVRHLVETFFDGSAEKAVAALLGGEAARLSDEELERIAALIERARKEGTR